MAYQQHEEAQQEAASNMGLARALGTSPSQAGKMRKCGHTIRADELPSKHTSH
jgi:hypothetical protein